ncbi:MAG TPA: hypothetical protein ENN21_02950 [Spirochaetes bacterium]|nr:hypothetical protein [Spirochaetota bacterium]
MAVGKKRIYIPVLIFLLCVQHFPGCTATQKISFPEQKQKAPVRGKRVVVSKFLVSSKILYESQRTTHSAMYTTHHYSSRTEKDLYDVSHLLARYLNRNGIPARSAKNLNFKQVGRNEVVITGAAEVSSKDWNSACAVFGLLVLVGAVLPNPVGVTVGADARYTYTVIDSQKKIIYHRDIQKGKVYYKWYWVWPALGVHDIRFKQARPIAIEEVFKDVVKALK